MATATNKQKMITQVFSALGKSGRANGSTTATADPTDRPVLEQFIYAVCREAATRDAADAAFAALKTRFFDWNEVRVSNAGEVADAFAGLTSPDARAQRIIDFLQEVFETTFSFDLEGLQKKGVKQAAKQLARYQAANDYAVAWVLQTSLDGHALPLDGPALRCLGRLGLIDDAGAAPTDLEAVRASLEHQVPKAKGALFVDLLSDLAEAVCWEADPACFECPLMTACPVGQEARRAAPVSARKPR